MQSCKQFSISAAKIYSLVIQTTTNPNLKTWIHMYHVNFSIRRFSFAAQKRSVNLRMKFWCLQISKKANEILDSFCPMKLGQKSVKNLVGFLEDLKTQKIHSEIN